MTPLTKNQWKKVLTTVAFSFPSFFITTFVTLFLAAGGVQGLDEASQAATLSVAVSASLAAFASAVNATLYAVKQLFVEDKE